jgi:glycerol transport system substrate-binding protein
VVAEHRRCVVRFEDAAGRDGRPKLNKKEKPEYWFAKAEKDGTVAPQRKLANEKPKGETIDYDALIKSWPATPPKRASN